MARRKQPQQVASDRVSSESRQLTGMPLSGVRIAISISGLTKYERWGSRHMAWVTVWVFGYSYLEEVR